MNEQEEAVYQLGSRAAWITMLRECLRHLGHEATAAAHAGWIIERAETIQALRQLCAEHGDNDWPDDLHLADVINKHLDL